ncbi:MAG: hypothetical protein ACPLSM_06805 [Thermosphaera sp.]
MSKEGEWIEAHSELHTGGLCDNVVYALMNLPVESVKPLRVFIREYGDLAEILGKCEFIAYFTPRGEEHPESSGKIHASIYYDENRKCYAWKLKLYPTTYATEGWLSTVWSWFRSVMFRQGLFMCEPSEETRTG